MATGPSDRPEASYLRRRRDDFHDEHERRDTRPRAPAAGRDQLPLEPRLLGGHAVPRVPRHGAGRERVRHGRRRSVVLPEPAGGRAVAGGAVGSRGAQARAPVQPARRAPRVGDLRGRAPRAEGRAPARGQPLHRTVRPPLAPRAHRGVARHRRPHQRKHLRRQRVPRRRDHGGRAQGGLRAARRGDEPGVRHRPARRRLPRARRARRDAPRPDRGGALDGQRVGRVALPPGRDGDRGGARVRGHAGRRPQGPGRRVEGVRRALRAGVPPIGPRGARREARDRPVFPGVPGLQRLQHGVACARPLGSRVVERSPRNAVRRPQPHLDHDAGGGASSALSSREPCASREHRKHARRRGVRPPRLVCGGGGLRRGGALRCGQRAPLAVVPRHPVGDGAGVDAGSAPGRREQRGERREHRRHAGGGQRARDLRQADVSGGRRGAPPRGVDVRGEERRARAT